MGSKSHGWWRFLAVEKPRRFEVEDGFADDEGQPNDALPSMRMVFTFEPNASGSRMRSVTYFPSLEAMEQLAAMGMEEGLRSALGQLDGVLADLAAFAAGRGTETQLLSNTQVRITRIIGGQLEQVWRAHQEPELLKRWLLGPDGWTMPVCEVARSVGDGYRYEWEKADGTERFGFEGELLELAAPHRAVTTERMIGMPGPATMNELTLTSLGAGTLLSLVVTYPDAETRDMVLGTGMTDGMERSYVRLEDELLARAPEASGVSA